MEIKLITQSEIKDEYKEIVKDAQVIKGTVAYWTWDKSFVESKIGKKYLAALKNKESFFCVDITSPSTNLDNIATCEKKGKNFYIFSYKFKNGTKGDEGILSLLHSKITYLKTRKNQFVFIGSHNNSKSAFDGNNMEHSILIKFSLRPKTEEKNLLKRFLDELDRIKFLCTKFDIKLLEYYKGMQIINGTFLPRIVLQLAPSEWDRISINQTISIITFFNLIQEKSDSQKNIKDKNLLVAIYNERGESKLFTAIGEADDEVKIGEMDEKVTDSNYIAIRIDGFSDLLGLPYLTFKSIPNRQVKGRAINFTEHLIQRFKLQEELKDYTLIKEFTGIPKKIDFFRSLTKEDIEILKKINYAIETDKVEKIDEKKHQINFLREVKKQSFKKAKNYDTKIEKNVTPELAKIINNLLNEFYYSIVDSSYSDLNIKYNINLEVLHIMAKRLLTKEHLPDLTFKVLQKKLKNEIDNICMTKSKNRLSQFEGKFYRLSPEDIKY
jgi:hypothetical protein